MDENTSSPSVKTRKSKEDKKKWRPSFKLFSRKDSDKRGSESNEHETRVRSKTSLQTKQSSDLIIKPKAVKPHPLLKPRSLAAISVNEIEHVHNINGPIIPKPKIKPQFGINPVELLEKFPDEAVPLILIECINILEKDIRKEGIFRIPGRMTNILEMKDSFEAGKGLNVEEPSTLDIAGLVAQFFRELPEPLLMYDLYYNWIEAVKKENEENIRESLKDMLTKIPEANLNILRYFIQFLSNVGKNSGANRMGPRNLALVFGASLLNPPSIDQYDLENIKLQCSVIEHMITSYGSIFEGEDNGITSGKIREKQVATIPAGNPSISTPRNTAAVGDTRKKSFMKRKSTFFAVSHSSSNSSKISDLITPITRSYQSVKNGNQETKEETPETD